LPVWVDEFFNSITLKSWLCKSLSSTETFIKSPSDSSKVLRLPALFFFFQNHYHHHCSQVEDQLNFPFVFFERLWIMFRIRLFHGLPEHVLDHGFCMVWINLNLSRGSQSLHATFFKQSDCHVEPVLTSTCKSFVKTT
jgi:hypothetical protein